MLLATCIRLSGRFRAKNALRPGHVQSFSRQIPCGSVSTRNFQVAVRFSLLVTSSNLEQVAIVLCAQANSVSYPSWDMK